MKQEVKQKILKKAISLETYGISDLAWTKDAAMSLIKMLLKDDIGILGGDVYGLNRNSLKALSDNWFCEPHNNESQESFFLRSKIVALTYIAAYPTSPNEELVFSIIFTESIC